MRLATYYNITGMPSNLALSTVETATTLSFHDAPADKCLAGSDPSILLPALPRRIDR